MAKLREMGYTAPTRSIDKAVADYVGYLEAGYRHLGWS
jgi:hypothetical protein